MKILSDVKGSKIFGKVNDLEMTTGGVRRSSFPFPDPALLERHGSFLRKQPVLARVRRD